MNSTEQIRSLLAKEEMRLAQLSRRIGELGGKQSAENLCNKLRRGSMRYDDALIIAQALGYKITWTKIKS